MGTRGSGPLPMRHDLSLNFMGLILPRDLAAILCLLTFGVTQILRRGQSAFAKADRSCGGTRQVKGLCGL